VNNRLGRLLDIDVPIVLAPFGGLSSIDLTATVSRLGGLGSYGLYGYGADRIRETVESLREATDRPFALNLWLPTGDEVEPVPGDFDRYASALAPLFDRLDLPLPELPDRYLPPLEEQIQTVLELEPPVVSFVFGVPPGEVVEEARRRGIVVIGTATTVDEALALEQGGVDAVAVAGAEGAGHRVSFIEEAEDSLVGTIALVPQVADAVTVPVIAAGGIADRRGVAAAFALGAEAVQIGTAFLRTRQSAANDSYREAIDATPAHGTVLTRAMSGRLARGAPNDATRTIEADGAIAPFPAQNWLTGRFRGAAATRGLGELQSLWIGQASGCARFDDAEELFAELARGVPANRGR
jgi:nitronate monooxygenase